MDRRPNPEVIFESALNSFKLFQCYIVWDSAGLLKNALFKEILVDEKKR